MNDLTRFHTLGGLIFEQYRSRNFLKVFQLVDEYLKLANKYKDDWNYGNAIHQSYTYLGLLSIDQNKISRAKEYLIKAGSTPGSPQLNNFGPNMLLAEKLLRLNQVDVVLEYIDICKSFWCFFFRITKTIKWKWLIKNGKVPNFGASLSYHIQYC